MCVCVRMCVLVYILALCTNLRKNMKLGHLENVHFALLFSSK